MDDEQTTTTIERLAADEVGELIQLRQSLGEADAAVGKAREELMQAVGAFNYVFRRLVAKYGLSEKDGFTDAGEIVRG